MKIKENLTRYEDFKYVLQDVGNLYLGAGFSYEELLLNEAVPFKLKAILRQYVLKEADPENTLESQFYYLEKDSFLYEIFSQLKIRIKGQVQKEKKHLFGKSTVVYQEKIYTLQEITQINLAKKKASGLLISEIIVSQMGMMMFSV